LCTRPDFATNDLGTCKHIEFTPTRLAARRGGKSALARGFAPAYSEVYLHHAGQPAVRFRPGTDCPPASMRQARRLFDAEAGWTLPVTRLGELDGFIALARKTVHELRIDDRALAFAAQQRDAGRRRQALAVAYEKEGGPGLAACAELIRLYSAQPAVDLRHLVRWVFFNLYVGNNDSHAKNLSTCSVPCHGVTLTPFYDLMCTRLYPGLPPEFAFAIGGEVRPGEMGATHLALMARQLGMQPALPGSTCARHGRPRARRHRTGRARDRAVAHAVGTSAGRAARALRVIAEQEAVSAPGHVKASTGKTRRRESSPTLSASCLASSSPASPDLAPPSSSSIAGRQRPGRAEARRSASHGCGAQATRCANSSTRPPT